MSRRKFLSLAGLMGAAASSLAFRRFLPEEDRFPALGWGRVTYDAISVWEQPAFSSDRAGKRLRDEVLTLFEAIESADGPAHNPRWYRVLGGYVHSGYVQRFDIRLNRVLQAVPEEGQIAEVTVPYTQSMQFWRTDGWLPLYRLYYGSHHWITEVGEGPDGSAWYRLTDDRIGIKYWVPGRHLRPVAAHELTPISAHVPAEEKRIEVSIGAQTVTCYEGAEVVFQTTVATGTGGPTTNDIPRHTPEGRFYISWKMPVRHMGNGEMTDDVYAYELPGVPWCSFFVSTGVAFHGTYWHDNYGTKMSAGCVNMKPDEAKWLFRWTTPALLPGEWYKNELGTRIDVLA